MKSPYFFPPPPMHPGFEAGLYYPPPFMSGSIGNTALTSGQIYYTYYYVPTNVVLTAISLVVGTAAASTKLRMGIYNVSGGNPTKLVIDAGEVDSSTTGTKDALISLTLPPGWYALAVTPSAAGVSVNALNLVSGNSGAFAVGVSTISTTNTVGKRASFTYGTLPTAAPATSITTNIAVPLVCLKT